LSFLVARQEVIGWLKETITAIVSGRGTTTITGAVSLLLVSVGMFRSLEYVLNHIFGIRPRSYIRSYLIGIGFSLILNILLLVTVIASPVFNMLSANADQALTELFKNLPWLGTLSDLLTSWFLFALISFFIYFILPNVKQRFRDVFWGAVTAGLLWGLLKILFNIYLNYFSNMTLVYGALAVVLGAIIWVYMSTIIIIFGAEITHVLGLRSKGVPAPSFDNLFRRASRSLLSINLPVKLQKGKVIHWQKPS
jgi:membrane protein